MEQEPEHMVYSEEQYLEAIRDNEPATTQEVADAIGVTRQGADYRLRQMADDGPVEKQLVGNTLIWTVESGPQASETASATRDVVSPTGDPGPGETADSGRDGGAEDTDALDDVDFPSTKDRDECVTAVLAARDYIRENDGATMRELVDAVMPPHSLGYNVPDLAPGDRFRGAWWRHVVKPGLEALTDVEKPDSSESVWRYVEGEQ